LDNIPWGIICYFLLLFLGFLNNNWAGFQF
jgi:hypothetical protein